MTDFENVWKTLPALDVISQTVTEEIDILKGANPDFIDFVAELETTLDLEARAKKAKDYIDANNGIKEIKYEDLGNYLANPNSIPLEIWRKLYVLERSIPPRFGNKYTWVARLKMFYNTFIRESAIAGKASYKGKKLYWIKGNADNPTNHDKLVYGKGKWGPDFYFYDDSLPGDKPWQKMVKVEMKHGAATLDSEIKKYADNKFLYNAKYLIIAMSDGYYYTINYNASPAEATKLDVICQDAYNI